MSENTSKTKTAVITRSFDFNRFLFSLLTYWYWVLLSLIISYIVAYVINNYSTPTYNVYGSLITDDQSNPGETLGGMQFYKRRSQDNEIMVLRSFSLIETTLKELDFRVTYRCEERFRDIEIYKNSPFLVEVDTTFNQVSGIPYYIDFIDKQKFKLYQKDQPAKIYYYNQEIVDENKKITISLRDTSKLSYNPKQKYYFVINEPTSIVNTYISKLNVKPYSSSSSVLWLWIIGEVPLKEADFINKLMEKYIKFNLDEKNKIGQNTIRFIDDRLRSIVDSLRIAEEDIQSIILDNNFYSPSGGGSEMLFKNLSDMQNTKNQLNFKMRYYKFLNDDVDRKMDFKDLVAPSIAGITDELLISNISKLQELYDTKEVKKYQVKIGENFPELDMLDISIKNTKDMLKKVIQSSIIAISGNLNELNSKIVEITSQIQKLPLTERQMQKLNRKHGINDNIYTYLLQKRMEASITLASNKSDIKVLDDSRMSQVKQETPKKEKNTSTALLIGLMVPIVLLVVKDFMTSLIEDKSDVEKATEVPVIATIGHCGKGSDLPVYSKPKSSIAESFRALRTNLQYLLVDDPFKVVALTSSVGGEGKSFCSANLAAIFATSNKKTLIIGLDLRKPRLHTKFGYDNDMGLTTYLIGKQTYEEIILNTYIPNLYVVLAGPIPPNPSELIDSRNMREFMKRVKSEFDYIVIDTPPIGLVTDALLISSFSDITIYVLRQNYTSKHVFPFINDLNDGKISKMAILINDMKLTAAYRYAYNYGYGYGYGYGGSYGYSEDEKPKNIFGRIKEVFTTKKRG